MNKFLAIILFLFILSTSFVFAAENRIVKDIQVKGNQNIKASVVKDEIKLKKKKPFSNDTANDDIRNILGTGKFKDASIELVDVDGGVIVVYNVVEKPKIVKIDFQGNEQVKTGKLKSLSEIKKKDIYDTLEVSRAEDKLREYYSDKGYASAKIESYVDVDESSNEAVLTFYVTEGKKYVIGEISFVGNMAFRSKKLRKQMKKIKPKKVFKEELFNQGLEDLKRFYLENAYLKMEIRNFEKLFDEDNAKINILINVYEGIRYKVGDITVKGNVEVDSKTLLNDLPLQKDKFYKQKDFEASVMNIQEIYGEKGYIRAQVRPSYKYNKDVVDINFNISENGIVYVDKIYIDGNNVTRDYVIRRSILLKEGEPINVKKVRRSQEKIYNLGFFQNIDFDLEQTGDDTANLLFNVTEQKTGLASVGVGYSSEDGLVGTLQLSETNLFGRGQKISFLWEFGERRQNYQISFYEPYFFGTYTSFGIDVFDIQKSKEAVYTTDSGINTNDWYEEQHQGGAVKFGRRFSDYYSGLVSYGFDRVRISEVENDTSLEHIDLVNEAAKGYQDVSSVSLSFTRDSRNNVFDPSRGSYTNINSEFAGGVLGGDNDFVKTLFTHSRFYKTFWKFILGFNVNAGIVTEYGDSSEVPWYERFYVGGSESVRGYDYRGDIGPNDGANYKLVYNVEYKFPIAMESGRTILQGAFFFDVGGAWDDNDKITLEIGSEDNRMKCGWGFGIRFNTPAFPIRVDWGYGFNKKEGDTPSQFYFTIGQLF